MEKRLSTLPGNAYEITQPIQMRFNELIAGVRGDIAVKVFGDDFGGMNDAAGRIADILRKTRGAMDVRVEQTEGLPMLDIRPNRMAMSRIGVTAGDVRTAINISSGQESDVVEINATTPDPERSAAIAHASGPARPPPPPGGAGG